MTPDLILLAMLGWFLGTLLCSSVFAAFTWWLLPVVLVGAAL